MNNPLDLQTLSWEGTGYQPLLRTDGWMASLMNWEDSMGPERALSIERHSNSDEVFILLQGKAAFYLIEGDSLLRVVEMERYMLYNVPRGVWHNTLATRDVKFAIIENDGTDKTGTEVRALTSTERSALLQKLPPWSNRE
jgi:mannose-6-phosphate isomerase-like protein (cupin superfamily)